MDTLMIIFTLAFSGNGGQPISISQTTTIVSAAACANAQRALAIRNVSGEGPVSLPEFSGSPARVQVVVKCVPMAR